MPFSLRFKISITVLSLTAVAVLCTDSALAHKFEDGYVERTVAVRIRDREGRINYSIGLNDATMEKFRRTWPDDQALYEQFQADQAAAVGKQNRLALNSKPTAEDQINLPEEGTLVNEIELIRAFAKVANPQLKMGLRVIVNKQPVTLKLVSSEPSARHHATLETIWKFELPSDPVVLLSVRDTNFLRQPGGIKYSLKTSGSSMTLQSNVAPIIIRSRRLGLDSISVQQRLLGPGITAKVRVLQQQDSD